jgi:tRNA (cmo5U34)-methyltransferase
MASRFEEMASFFDVRVDGYDEHMQGLFKDFELYYSTVARQVQETDDEVNILDLGCGTGTELQWIFERAPRARVVGVDVSQNMLERLRSKFERYAHRMHLIHGSYLALPFAQSHYDYVVSVYTMHHFTQDTKCMLYKRIYDALKPGGTYIEGDCVVTALKQQEIWEWYKERYSLEHIREACNPDDTLYHFDIPGTIEAQLQLFRESGFSCVDVVWHEEGEEPAIFTATK